jgi:hypothetical protein
VTLVRVYCGLASADDAALAPDSQVWLTVSIVDDAGRLLDICEVSDDAGGYAELCALFAQRGGGPGSVAVATENDEHVVTQLLAAAGRYIAYADEGSADDYAERFADDDSPDEIRSGPAERRAIGLARSLQAGVLSAVPQGPPRELVNLKPLLNAHAALVSGRQQAASTLREVLRELYPAALRAYADPAERVSLAVLQALPEAGLLVAGPGGRSREGQVIGTLVETGVAEKSTLVEAVTALRVAVAETPRRAGVTRGMTSAVAETVRQAVSAVQCCDAATEALVLTIADRMTVPVRAATPAPPVAPAEPAPALAGPLRVVTGPAPAAEPGPRHDDDLLAPAVRLSRPAVIEPVPVTPAASAGLEAAMRPVAEPPAAHMSQPMPYIPEPSPYNPSIVSAPPAAASLPGMGLTSTGQLPPISETPVSTPPAVTPPLVGRRAAADPVEPLTPPVPAVLPMRQPQSSQPAAVHTTQSGQFGQITYPVPRPPAHDRSRGADNGLRPAEPPVPRLSPEVPAPGSRASWPVSDPTDDAPADSGSVVPAFGTGAADLPRPIDLPRQREGRVTPPWQADDLPIEPPTLRLVEPAPLADPALSIDRPPVDDLGADLRFDPPTLRLVGSDGSDWADHAPRRSRPADELGEPPVESGDDDSDLLIFAACRSAWFTDPDEFDDDVSWSSMADSGWEAAELAAKPAVGDETTAGLPRRVPQQNLVPGSPPTPPEDDRPLRIVRDAASIAAHTSGYFSGYRRGQEVGGYAVGGRPGRESVGGWDFSRDEPEDEQDYMPSSEYEYRSARR